MKFRFPLFGVLCVCVFLKKLAPAVPGTDSYLITISPAGMAWVLPLPRAVPLPGATVPTSPRCVPGHPLHAGSPAQPVGTLSKETGKETAPCRVWSPVQALLGNGCTALKVDSHRHCHHQGDFCPADAQMRPDSLAHTLTKVDNLKRNCYERLGVGRLAAKLKVGFQGSGTGLMAEGCGKPPKQPVRSYA